MQSKTRNDTAEWYEFIDSFLDIVELSCKEILEPKHTIKFTKNIEIKYGNHLKIAIIYNLKHAIELIIKTFIQEVKGELDKKDRIHNLDKLFNKFNSQKSIKKLRAEANKLKSGVEKDTIINILKAKNNSKSPFENSIETIKKYC
ncbi:hypothetical protein IPJ72_04435 [Candidatus Peregrinibacteria bacterium]|nr:MAG: hypothetical protein IPJ72_04435 [Candidatus Peregrinibacteria bacterium]